MRFYDGDYVSATDGAARYARDAQLAALTASGRTARFRMYVLTAGNVRLGSVPFSEGRVDWNAEAAICRSMSCRILEETAREIDWNSQRMQPAMQLRMPDGGWCEWPLGVFLPTTPGPVRRTSGERYYAVEAYDPAKVLADDLLTAPLTIAAGERYLDAAYAQLEAAGISRLVRDDSDATLAAALQYEPGVSRQTIVNDLLAAVNFRPVWFDEYGNARFTAYQPPYARRIAHTYAADARSVVTPEGSTERDTFEVPNVIVCVVSQAEAALSAMWTNDNPASPLSIPRRGRKVVKYVQVTDIADQATLDEYAERLGNQLSAVSETANFETLTMPGHGAWDVLFLDLPDASGKYEEITWSLDMADGGRMQHSARKVIFL